MGYRVALLSLVLFSTSASADRLFAAERYLDSTAIPGATSYEWEIAHRPAWTWERHETTSEPSLRVYHLGLEMVQYRLRATNPDGAGPWSDPSEPARWLPNVNCDGNPQVGVSDFGCFLTVFGLVNCGAEYLTTCP